MLLSTGLMRCRCFVESVSSICRPVLKWNVFLSVALCTNFLVTLALPEDDNFLISY